jgi:hypothetical protein
MYETDISALQCYLAETPKKLELVDIAIYIVISRALLLVSLLPGMYVYVHFQ